MAPTEDANGRLVSGSWNGSYTPSPPLSPSDSEQSVEKLSQRDPLELSLSLQDLDNTCEIYFCGWDSTPTTTASNSVSVRHLAVPGASEDFRRAMGTTEATENSDQQTLAIPSPCQPRSQPQSSPVTSKTPPSSSSSKKQTSSGISMSLSSSSASSTSSSSFPFVSSSSSTATSSSSSSSSSSSKPTLTAALSLVLSPLNPEKPPKKSKSKLWQPSVFLPSVSSSNESSTEPSQTSTSAGSSSRRPASFGDADAVKYRHAFRRASHGEKHVSWADEFGSTYKLTSVKLIRPRLDAADSGKKSGASVPTPGRSILRDTGAK